jgi:hypothetical protein
MRNMTKHINIQDITAQSLRDKKYLHLLPEVYALEHTIENNLWHHNQNVLDHCIAVFEGLEIQFQYRNIPHNQSQTLQKYFAKSIGNISRKEILKICVLLHDIAKPDTIITAKDGTNRCIGHELIASGRVALFADRFDLKKISQQYIERIILYHGLISDILTLIIEYGKKDQYLKIFHDTVGDIEIDLIFHMKADLLGSNLEKADKKAYRDRMDILSWMLAERIPS